jgi:hypothetical protein
LTKQGEPRNKDGSMNEYVNAEMNGNNFFHRCDLIYLK